MTPFPWAFEVPPFDGLESVYEVPAYFSVDICGEDLRHLGRVGLD